MLINMKQIKGYKISELFIFLTYKYNIYDMAKNMFSGVVKELKIFENIPFQAQNSFNTSRNSKM